MYIGRGQSSHQRKYTPILGLSASIVARLRSISIVTDSLSQRRSYSPPCLEEQDITISFISASSVRGSAGSMVALSLFSSPLIIWLTPPLIPRARYTGERRQCVINKTIISNTPNQGSSGSHKSPLTRPIVTPHLRVDARIWGTLPSVSCSSAIQTPEQPLDYTFTRTIPKSTTSGSRTTNTRDTCKHSPAFITDRGIRYRGEICHHSLHEVVWNESRSNTPAFETELNPWYNKESRQMIGNGRTSTHERI